MKGIDEPSKLFSDCSSDVGTLIINLLLFIIGLKEEHSLNIISTKMNTKRPLSKVKDGLSNRPIKEAN